MHHIDDSIERTVRGDDALSGTTHAGKQALGQLWGELMSRSFTSMDGAVYASAPRGRLRDVGGSRSLVSIRWTAARGKAARRGEHCGARR